MIDPGRFQSGDHPYFNRLVRDLGPMVLRVCTAYAESMDDAEDLFQMVWIQVYAKRRSYQGNGPFRVWLRRIANNVCISELRARKRRREGLRGLEGDPQGEEMRCRPTDPLNEMERLELHLRLIQALDQLPPREEEAISMRILDERTPRETAELMGVEQATVRSTIRHGIKRLKEILEVEEQ